MAVVTGQEPIRAEWRVSQVLARYPQVLETLIHLSPSFRHLRNPVMRRVQAPLVTLGQAARIAGVEPETVVRALNDALGLLPPAPESPVHDDERAADMGSWDAPVVEDLDARPYQARGEEPLTAILTAADRVPAGQALRLRNTFEPVPLYRVLGLRGFSHIARQHGPEDWEVLFVRTDGPRDGLAAGGPAPRQEERNPREESVVEEPVAVVRIDVSDLVPPEPMVRILEAAAKLAPGQVLLVDHVRRPVYLYPQLDNLGYAHETSELPSGRVEILIRRPEA